MVYNAELGAVTCHGCCGFVHGYISVPECFSFGDGEEL